MPPHAYRMKDERRKSVWMALALLVFALSSCGGGGGMATSGEGGGMVSGRASEDVSSSAGGLAMSEAAAPESGVAESGGFDRKVIKTADLGIRAENVREGASEAQSVADDFGGSVLESRVDRGGESVSADLVLSVPSPEFEDALDELRGLGEKVTTDAVRGEDITEEFVDLESRERNLLAAEESLLSLYDEVENVNEALAIERELSDVRGQIEQSQGRIEYLEARTSSSRINLNIRPVATPAEEPAWNPSEVASDAWTASLAVLQTLATAAISTVVFGWWLAPLFVVGLMLWRRRNSGRSAPGGVEE